MNIPRHWANATAQVFSPAGREYDLTVWGWSDTAQTEATWKAQERLTAAAQRIQQGHGLSRGYAYGDLPLREEIVREVRNEQGQPFAVVTRNNYGSLILNTRETMFVDVDFPRPPRTGLLAWLLGKKKRLRKRIEQLDHLRAALASLGGSYRIYRTAAGWRVLATDRSYDPRADTTREVMEAMDADPSFVRLCRVQESFRARLSPKPWRCGMRVPPGKHPREDGKLRADFSAWLAAYDKACSTRATCRFLELVGSGPIAPGSSPILELHDALTRASADLPLA